MIDIKLLRTQRELIEDSLSKRGASINLDQILEKDQQRRHLLSELGELKQQRNDISAKIGKKLLVGDEKTKAIEETRLIGQKIKEGDQDISELDEFIHNELLCIPNLLDPATPAGSSEEDNQLVRTWGTPNNFTFTPIHHADLGEKLGVFDFERGVKLSGTRFSALRGKGALLERALANFMLDLQTQENGYEEILPPFLVSPESMTGTGQLPKFGEDMFKTTTDLYLIPTGEVPLTNMHRNEILQEKDLPIYYTALTPCFRSEAGSYGRDTKGYIRQHQFNKVELVKFCHPSQSEEEHEKLTQNAEKVLQLLEIPYRVMTLCSGDIGFGAAKCYDIEAWIPSENKYREISSCSNFKDFQARRAGIKFKPKEGGKPEFVHTLNGSGLAVGRTLVAILENYQQEDGSVKNPSGSSFLHKWVDRAKITL